MIVRQGFVSNSSSSSFIVAFPKKEEKLNHDELYDLMCPNHDTRYNMDENYHLVDSWYQNEGDPKKSDEDVIERVYRDIGSVLTEDKILELLGRSFGYEAWEKFKNEYPKDFENLSKEKRKVICDTIQAKQEEWQKKQAKPEYDDLILEAEKKYGKDNYVFYSFHYADEEGEGWLEHSGIFYNLPSKTISHH